MVHSSPSCDCGCHYRNNKDEAIFSTRPPPSQSYRTNMEEHLSHHVSPSGPLLHLQLLPHFPNPPLVTQRALATPVHSTSPVLGDWDTQ